MLRTILANSNSDIDNVMRLSHMTTSKGRAYRKMQLNRLVQLTAKQYKKRGAQVNKDKIRRNLLDQAVSEWVDVSERSEDHKVFLDRSQRQRVFEKNYKKY